MRSLILGLLASVFVLSAGCARPPAVMHLQPPGSEDALDRVWPAPPERPRYRYVGQLLGEQNFGRIDPQGATFGRKVFEWIVGLGRGLPRDPLVLVRPQSGVVGPQGRIFVTDAGAGAVFVFDPVAAELEKWTSADEGLSFRTPVGIAVSDAGEVWVADAGLGRVVHLSSQGRSLGSLGNGVLQRPTGLAREPDTGNLYVADTGMHDIKVYDQGGRLLRRIGGPGTAPGQFNRPTHLALHGDALLVSDTLNARIQVLDLDGTPRRSIGSRGLYLGNLTRPKGVTVDSAGHVYVVESYYDHLLVFDAEGRFLLPIGGTGKEVGHFYLPAGAWRDPQDRIYVADMYNGRVVIFQFLGG